MRSEETTGKTVEEAISRALSRLGLRRDQVDVDVITEGKAGLFGLGAQDARVRVTAKDSVIPISASPVEGGRRDREGGDAGEARTERPERDGGARSRRGRRGGRRRGGAGRGEQPVGADGTAGEQPPRSATGPAADSRPARPPRSGTAAGDRARGGRGGRDAGDARDERGGRGGRGRDGDTGGRPREREDAPPRARGSSVRPDEEVRVPGVPDEFPRQPIADPADDMDLAGSTLRDILTLLGLTATEITAREPDSDGDGIGLIEQVFDIFGEDDDTSDELGVLIGRRGETLAALQYVVNTIVARGQQKAPVYGIDIEGYKRRREQMLVDLAKEIAQEVRETGDVITLEPMPAYERRIIHLALRDEPGVKTESVGSGDNRQVEVLPAD